MENGLRTLICCIGKNENRYVREYVEWYKNIGITHIRLYDNNDIDGERFEEVIGDYIDDGFVEIVDYRGRVNCQLTAYNECYKDLGNEYDWLFFIDCGDEYLFLTKDKNVSEFLSLPQFNGYDMIHLNLMTFGDCGQLEPSNKPLNERFRVPIPFDKKVAYENIPENAHISSILRGGLENVIWLGTTHTPYPNKFKCCNDMGEEVNSESPFANISFRRAYFKHFTTKTCYEYCDKMRRGFPDQIWDGSRIENLIVTRFFRTNEVTKEKIEVFKKELGIDVSYLLPKEFNGVKDENVKIFSLCYSKKDFQFLNDRVITPLQVGAANGTDVCDLKDNSGDNISDKNYFYIENTGTYWIWKNVNAKYKGQMQYRRPLESVDETMDFEQVFSNYDVITCKPLHHPDFKEPTAERKLIIPADTVEQGYGASNCIDDLYIMEMIIELYYPEYKESYNKYIKNGPDLYYSNGFILRAEDFDRYCEFLFGCLEKYQNMVDVSTPLKLYNRVKYNMEVGKYPKHSNPQTRTENAIKWQMSIGGFLSERLWTLWVLHNFERNRIMEIPYVKMEEGMFT